MTALLQGLSLGLLEESGDTVRGCGPVVASDEVCCIALGALRKSMSFFRSTGSHMATPYA